MKLRALACFAALAAAPSYARADDASACNDAIASAQRVAAMPKRVLRTIALVESGRTVGKRVVPWPWSINVEGVGYHYQTKDEAIAAVRSFTAAGQRSIDVGCMQINLAAHPTAFRSLDTAFEPTANADYAAHFLHDLYRQSGRIATAITAYHSQTPEYANDYARRILAIWPGAADLGLTASPAQPQSEPQQPRSHIHLDTAYGSAASTRPVLRPVARPVSLRSLQPVHGGAWPR
ncbi:MAG: transglycosylase SLT domain-containing protein [Acetobacteraceae bacterium]|nr:transglycosylase SLT domain-containing protein [Acetobacteraceae bacterium]